MLIYLKLAAAFEHKYQTHRSLKAFAWSCSQRLQQGFKYVLARFTHVVASCWQRLKKRERRGPAASLELTTVRSQNDDLL